jgi:ABC-type ATPase with predicted acetyltransferase domain
LKASEENHRISREGYRWDDRVEMEKSSRRMLRRLTAGLALVIFTYLRIMAEEKANGKDLKWGQW